MVNSKQQANKKEFAVFVSKLSSLLLPNWESFGFDGLPTYQAIAAATGINPRTVSKWMQKEPFEQLDSETAAALIRFFESRQVSCNLTDLIEIQWRDQPLRPPTGKTRGRKPRSEKKS